MKPKAKNYLRWFGVVICVLLILDILISIYFIGIGLYRDNAVPADREHFEFKFLIYIIEVIIFSGLVIYLSKIKILINKPNQNNKA